MAQWLEVSIGERCAKRRFYVLLHVLQCRVNFVDSPQLDPSSSACFAFPIRGDRRARRGQHVMCTCRVGGPAGCVGGGGERGSGGAEELG